MQRSLNGVARIGDTHHDRTVSECFPCRWPEIKYKNKTVVIKELLSKEWSETGEKN